MREFVITVGRVTRTFSEGIDFGPGESRQHWTLSGLQKLIELGLWRREIDKRGNLKAKPPTVEMIRRLSAARRFSSSAH